MDNIIIPAVGTAGIIISQTGGSMGENITAMGILAMCIWYFLYKFDKKLDLLLARTDKIENVLDGKQDKEEE